VRRGGEKDSNVKSIMEEGHNWLCGAERYCSDHHLCSYSVDSQHFMEPEGSLPHSQQLSNFTYPEPDQSSPQHWILSIQGPS
jgi:hypothetical protein